MAKKQRYEVLVGLNYAPNNQRAGVGSVVDDIPETSLPWLLEDGLIVKTEKPLNRSDDQAPAVCGAAADTGAPPAEV